MISEKLIEWIKTEVHTGSTIFIASFEHIIFNGLEKKVLKLTHLFELRTPEDKDIRWILNYLKSLIIKSEVYFMWLWVFTSLTNFFLHWILNVKYRTVARTKLKHV